MKKAVTIISVHNLVTDLKMYKFYSIYENVVCWLIGMIFNK